MSEMFSASHCSTSCLSLFLNCTSNPRLHMCCKEYSYLLSFQFSLTFSCELKMVVWLCLSSTFTLPWIVFFLSIVLLCSMWICLCEFGRSWVSTTIWIGNMCQHLKRFQLEQNLLMDQITNRFLKTCFVSTVFDVFAYVLNFREYNINSVRFISTMNINSWFWIELFRCFLCCTISMLLDTTQFPC